MSVSYRNWFNRFFVFCSATRSQGKCNLFPPAQRIPLPHLINFGVFGYVVVLLLHSIVARVTSSKHIVDSWCYRCCCTLYVCYCFAHAVALTCHVAAAAAAFNGRSSSTLTSAAAAGYVAVILLFISLVFLFFCHSSGVLLIISIYRITATQAIRGNKNFNNLDVDTRSQWQSGTTKTFTSNLYDSWLKWLLLQLLDFYIHTYTHKRL